MKIESVLSLLFVIALIFKKLHLPGSNIIFVTLLFSVATVYFIFAFYLFCDKTIQQHNILFSIISGILLSIAPLAILFEIMNWNNANKYILFGLPITIVIFILSFFLKSKAPIHLKTYYQNMLLRSGVLALLQLLFAFF